MRVIDGRQFEWSRATKTRKKRRLLRTIFALIAVAVFGAYGCLAVMSPLPLIKPLVTFRPSISSSPLSLPFPAYGQTAIGAEGFGLLSSTAAQKPVPSASVIKVLTALAVLQKHPLQPGQPGPTITLDAADIAFYQANINQDGSVVPVAVGEQISQYQALQALLLPSANNIADTLARWAFGSVENYVIYANDLAQSMGLKNTHVADASGLSPGTVSTASDLVMLGQAALKQPVLAEIVDQAQATIPVVGIVHNVNRLVADPEIVGIKTGSTNEAGGCFLFAATHMIDASHKVTVIGAILGAPTRDTAINAALPLLQSTYKEFAVKTVLRAGQELGYYSLPWDGNVPAVAAGDISVLAWQGATLQTKVKSSDVQAPLAAGSRVGSTELTAGSQIVSSPLVLKRPLTKPGLVWRFLHPIR